MFDRIDGGPTARGVLQGTVRRRIGRVIRPQTVQKFDFGNRGIWVPTRIVFDHQFDILSHHAVIKWQVESAAGVFALR